MSLRTDLLQLLEYGRQIELNFAGELTEEQRALRGSPAQWAPKDILPHLALYRLRAVDTIAALRRGEAPVAPKDGNAFNDAAVIEHADDPWPRVMGYARRGYLALRHTVDGLSDDELRNLIVPGSQPRPLWRALSVYGYSHTVGHIAGWYDANGQPELGERLVEESARLLGSLDAADDWQGTQRYSLAAHYARTGQAGRALDELRTALRLNPALVERSKRDPDLVSLHPLAEYQSLYK